MQSRIANLGSQSLAMPREAGIASMDDLVALGSVKAYLRAKEHCPLASLRAR